MNKAIKSASEAEAVICPNKSVMKLEPYKQGAAAAGGFENPIKLSSNESPFGPPPAALKAYHDAGSSLFRYPDGAQTSLRGAIAEVFGLNADRIVCGNGSEELQLLLVRSFLSPGDDVVMSEHSFVMGRIHAIAQGANIITAPEPEGRADAKSILAKLTPKTRMIMLASPNNPVGDYMRAEDFRFLVKNTPSDVVILYDGAYADYVTADDYDDGFSYVGWSPNVVVTRTFSKLYGLAGLRIGWLYAHDLVIDPVQRIRTPFNANVAALAAAEAAIRDREFAGKVAKHNANWLARIKAELAEIGLGVSASVANFYLVRFAENGPHTAEKAAAFLMERGIIPRPVGADGPEGALRITVGLDHENEAVIDTLKAFVRT